MNHAHRILRQTLTIARRDFVATVFTPTFLIFLLAPLIMGGFGAISGIGAASIAESGADKARIVVIADPAEGDALEAADKKLRGLFSRRDDDRPPALRIDTPTDNVPQQARALFDAHGIEATAVLYGPLERPEILYARNGRLDGNYLAALAEEVLLQHRAGGNMALSQPSKTLITREGTSISGKSQLAFFGIFGLFFLSITLASQPVGTMAEERSNKVVEILAAAVPLESVFVGKLLGMFGSALLFLGFWGILLTNLSKFLPVNLAARLGDLAPAVGTPAFPLLFLAYFTMLYMLIGAVFLSVGAQASTPREIQMLVFPITVTQMMILGWCAFAAGHPDSWIATAAEVFPFSSPFAMIARAANMPELWPHFLALAWQLLWAGITVTIGATWFRRGVLNSGSPKIRLRRKQSAPARA